MITDSFGKLFPYYFNSSIKYYTDNCCRPFCDHRALTSAPFEHDQSLFERLVSPGAGGAPPLITLAQLDTQRRMRPEIANLLRALSLYPVLLDGENVKEYPVVPSMGGRHLAWVNHQVGERFGADKSFSNVYEAEMIAAHAGHLARTGEFGIRSMVVIVSFPISFLIFFLIPFLLTFFFKTNINCLN